MSKQVVLRCPSCKTLVTVEDEYFPFCSDRCRLIDLGRWASGGYRISSPVLDPEVLEGLNPPGQNQGSGRKDDDDRS
ncbi:MAG: DNA gyrase inhibitor YacG [Acidobacteriaceae bacterium]|nr:DNA gyrase inhibitor YacG [Acidobacteriaceae bacterium]